MPNQKNPFNDSPLVFKSSGSIHIYISDEYGNEILKPENLIGITTYEDSPSDYFRFIPRESICKGKIVIPKKYEYKL